MNQPTVMCPDCFEQIELPIELVQEVNEEGDLSVHVNVDPQPLWDHAAKHVWNEAGGPQ